MNCYELKRIKKRIDTQRLNKIEKLRSEAESTTRTFSGLTGSGRISDKVGNGSVSIVYLQTKLARTEQRITEEVIKLEEYLDSISDSYIRQIFRLRFQGCEPPGF